MIPKLVENHVENKQNVQHCIVFSTGDLSLMAHPVEIQVSSINTIALVLNSNWKLAMKPSKTTHPQRQTPFSRGTLAYNLFDTRTHPV
jgi:hypothetical protein